MDGCNWSRGRGLDICNSARFLVGRLSWRPIDLEHGEPMQYFNESDDKLERIGKVVGDTFAAILVLVLILIFVQSMIYR